jgi:hypothetical protein
VLPTSEKGPALGNRIDPMLLESCIQPITARHATTVMECLDFSGSKVSSWDMLVDLVALHLERVVDSSPRALPLDLLEAAVV